MPPLNPVPKVLRVGFKQILGEDVDCFNRLFISYSGTPPADPDLITFANAAMAAWSSHLASQVSDTLTLQQVEATDLTSSLGAQGTSTSAPVTGASASTDSPAATALVVRFHVARRYRGGHPRWYQAGMVAASRVDPQRWSSVTLSGFLTGWNAFVAALLAAGWSGAGLLDQVNVSYFTGFTNHTFPSGRVRPIPNPRPSPIVDAIIDTTLNPLVGSQRRRNLQSA